jgi:integrative and conjugative element protein (TIGR02256 family)
VASEPMPFQHFSQLVEIIGNGSSEEGIQRLNLIGFNKFKSLPDELLIAIRYPNRRQQIEFQAFLVRKVIPAEVTAPPLFCDPLETMKVAVINYSIVEAIVCEKFSDDTFFQRNAKRADRVVLKNCTANILGVGALGSEIADSLGKAGIGTLLLVDNQRMNAHNIVRHVAGLRQAGQFKVDAIRGQIKEHNPFIHVLALAYSVTGCEIGTELPEDSITVSSIADDNIESYINEQCVIINRPVFYARALRGGKVGRIIRVIPGIDACLNCLRLYRQNGGDFIEIPADANYPTLRNECNNPILPASAADLKLIAALTSRLVIDHLQNGNMDVNQWVWSSEVIPDTPLTQSFAVKEQFFKPHEYCQFCNSSSSPTFANIDEKVLLDMVEQVKSKAGTETGGVLAGYIDAQKNISILFASGPGPKAVQSPTKFEKDVEFCQKFLDDLYNEYGDKAIYLGEWHSHPNENNKPSNIDLRSLNDIANQKEYLTDQPIMIIFTKTGSPSCTIHPAGKSYRHIELRNVTGF